jgi:drug/metabolite transporter (DMT)-like permease
MLLEILSKVLSESLLSLYPIFVKYIHLPLELQLWSRFFSYLFISAFFINWKFILKHVLSISGLALSFVTMAHVYVSYRGFQILESGIAYIIFYTYPLIILLLAGKKITPIMIFALLGVYLLSQEKIDDKDGDTTLTNKVEVDNSNDKDQKGQTNIIFKKKNVQENFAYEGLIMTILAALTEAFIYFIVRDIKTDNNWNHLFLSYFFGTILLSGYFFNDILKMKVNDTLSISMVINLFIGLTGYLLRFYSATRLDTTLYAALSYIGILMAFVYGVLINGDVITQKKILGTVLILIPNFYLLFY